MKKNIIELLGFRVLHTISNNRRQKPFCGVFIRETDYRNISVFFSLPSYNKKHFQPTEIFKLATTENAN